MLLLNRRIPERTRVATRPAIIPFMEFDIAILPVRGCPDDERSMVPLGIASRCLRSYILAFNGIS
jgi:hypothetical protein